MQFQVLLTLFSKFFSTFPHGTFLLSDSGSIIAQMLCNTYSLYNIIQSYSFNAIQDSYHLVTGLSPSLIKSFKIILNRSIINATTNPKGYGYDKSVFHSPLLNRSIYIVILSLNNMLKFSEFPDCNQCSLQITICLQKSLVQPIVNFYIRQLNTIF